VNHRLDDNGECVDCGADSSRKIAKPCPNPPANKQRFFNLLRQAAKPLKVASKSKAPNRGDGCTGKKTRPRTSANGQDR
jgi:hypothetical protein